MLRETDGPDACKLGVPLHHSVLEGGAPPLLKQNSPHDCACGELIVATVRTFFLTIWERFVMIPLARKIKTFFTGFLKIVIFKWKNEKQNCFTAVENRGFSKRSVMKTRGFPQKRRLL